MKIQLPAITHYGEQDKNRDNKTRYNTKNALIILSYQNETYIFHEAK